MAGLKEVSKVTMLNTFNGEVIQRNKMYVFCRIVDINFINFEFLCELCEGGIMLSTAKCINQCTNPRPKLRIFMRCTIQDEKKGEAYVSMRDEVCCKVFGIDVTSLDVFKEYFFMHGPFFYKSAKPFVPEYGAVLEFFKQA